MFLFFSGALAGIVLFFFLLLVLFAFSQDLVQMISPLIVAVLKDVGGPVAAGFGGAISGAVCSYVFQIKNERKKEEKSEISTVHKTVVCLSAQLNDLYSIKKYNIYPSREHPARFLDISKIPSNPSVTERIDPKIIDVALSVKDATIIDVLYLADARYRACFENFSNRNLSLDEYRATLKQSNLKKGGGHSLEELYKAVGEGQLVSLHIMTEQMIEVLDEAIQTLGEAMAKVSAVIDKKYKGTGVTSLKMNVEENEYLNSTPKPYFDVESLKAYLNKFDG
ncbi:MULTISPECIES: hypothetical protein [unclassified Pseudomonas]|uniref:hypothetical protein n=1 Tax=unclassified Pseudomonas TaxID=196821 RepID=UPI000B81DC11|nr:MULTISPECIES: hypothetical protein [unclassified Pseudomonas]